MSETAKHLDRAEKFLHKGKLDAALREYQQVLALEPEHEAAAQAAAELCLKLGLTRDAIQLLQVLFDRQAATGQAVAATTYKRLAKLTPPTAEQSLRAAQLLEATHPKDALEAYEAALQSFRKAGDAVNVHVALEGIVALEPTVPRLQELGELALQRGEQKKAVGLFLEAAKMQVSAGQERAAVKLYARAYSLQPQALPVVLAYTDLLLSEPTAERAAKAIEVLQPFARGPEATHESRAAYGRALLAVGRAKDAEPFLWELFQQDPGQTAQVMRLLEQMLENGEWDDAIALARRLEEHQRRLGRLGEHASMMAQVEARHPGRVELLEYLVELFNTANRERDYCAALLKLFELYYAAGNFLRAGECLDRAAEVDAYEPGHKARLDLLRGKVDGNRLRTIAARLMSAVTATDQEIAAVADSTSGDEPTVLEDLMLQAEIFLQYSLRSRALERLERVRKLFPGEELKNEKLRELYLSAGMEVAQPGKEAAAQTALVRSLADEAAVDNIARVTEITRNISRQGSVKSVLFTTVNEVGRHWNATRCVAVLCKPGKPPSIALEYCAPGAEPSDVHAIVKLVAMLQPLLIAHGGLAVDESGAGPTMASLKQFAGGMGIDSLLAVPLVEGDEHTGLLLLAQGASARKWRSTDTVVLKTIADQIVLALANARLRSLVKNLAVTEERSGLLKRSSYLDVLLSEVRRATQQESTVSVMLMNFGNAAELSRERGEAAVESAMQHVGQLVCAHIRQNDIAVRYDLSTLALVLADTNDKNAFFAADKLRKVLAGNGRLPSLTVGIAEAVMNPAFDAVDIVTELINRAEAALQVALQEGGDNAHSLAPNMQTSVSA